MVVVREGSRNGEVCGWMKLNVMKLSFVQVRIWVTGWMFDILFVDFLFIDLGFVFSPASISWSPEIKHNKPAVGVLI